MHDKQCHVKCNWDKFSSLIFIILLHACDEMTAFDNIMLTIRCAGYTVVVAYRPGLDTIRNI